MLMNPYGRGRASGAFEALKKVGADYAGVASQLAAIRHKTWSDFFTATTPWIITGVNGGFATVGDAGTILHPGVNKYTSATASNSGGRTNININAILLSGGEQTTIIFKTSSTLTGVTRIMGFHSSYTYAAPTNGVYAAIQDGVISGKTALNGSISTTQTTFTMSPDTWYKLKIVLNSDATEATYTLFADNNNALLWQDTLSSNIPNVYGHEVGHGDICTYSGITSIVLGYIDYMDFVLPNSREVT